MPVFGLIPKEKQKSALTYCILISVTVNTVLPFLTSLSGGRINHNTSFVFPVCNGYLQYALIGCYLDKYKLSNKLKAIIYIYSVYRDWQYTFSEHGIFPFGIIPLIHFLRVIPTLPVFFIQRHCFCCSKTFRLISCPDL